METFIPVAAPFVVSGADRDVSLGEVPAARVAVLVHTGDYESMGNTNRSLGASVARNAHNASGREAMTLQLANITFDCTDAARVGAFWSAALHRPIDDGPNQWFASIGRHDESQTVWLFIKVPEAKRAKNRCHVDLRADDRTTEVARLLALGAQHHSDHDEHNFQWTTLLDVEGNEFCVA